MSLIGKKELYNIYSDFANEFKKPKELFDFEILFEYFSISGSDEFAERFIYKYLFAKTKGNKFIFKTEYTIMNLLMMIVKLKYKIKKLDYVIIIIIMMINYQQ